MADPLEAAAEALRAGPGGGLPAPLRSGSWERFAAVAVTAYLDSLLGDLPEEAVEAARAHEQRGEGCDRITVIDTEASVRRALTALRDSLVSGRAS